MTNIIFRLADALVGMIIDKEKVLDKKIAKAEKGNRILEKEIRLKQLKRKHDELEGQKASP